MEGLQQLNKIINQSNFSIFSIIFLNDFLGELPPIQEFSKNFLYLHQKLKELYLIKNWLQTLNVLLEVPIIKETDLATIQLWQLESLVIEYSEAIQLSDIAIKTLAFFLTKKSSLFEAISQKYRETIAKPVSIY